MYHVLHTREAQPAPRAMPNRPCMVPGRRAPPQHCTLLARTPTPTISLHTPCGPPCSQGAPHTPAGGESSGTTSRRGSRGPPRASHRTIPLTLLPCGSAARASRGRAPTPLGPTWPCARGSSSWGRPPACWSPAPCSRPPPRPRRPPRPPRHCPPPPPPSSASWAARSSCAGPPRPWARRQPAWPWRRRRRTRP